MTATASAVRGSGRWARRNLPVLIGGTVVAAVVLGFRIEPRPDYIVAVAAMLVSAALVSRASGLHLRRLTVPAVWYLSYLAGTAVPALFVAAEERSAYVTPFLFAVVATLFTAPLGMLLVNLASGFTREEAKAFFGTPLERRNLRLSELTTFLLLLAICLALTVGYFIETPIIPLFYLIRNPGSAAVLILMREESFKLLESRFVYAYDVARNVLYPFLITLSLGYYLISRRTGWLLLFLVTFGAGCFFAAASIQKMPVAVLVLVTTLFIYLYRGGQFSAKAAALGFAAVFLFPVAVLYQSQRGLGISGVDIGMAILRRLFYVPAEVLYNYFVVVPDVVPYLYGRTIGRVQWVLGGSEINIGNLVFRFMFPNRIESGIANTSFLGYLHADFGVVGILLGGALVGVLVQLLQVWLVRRRKTVTTLAAYAFLLWAAWKVNFQALPQTLLSGGIIIVLALVGFLRHGEAFFRLATTPAGGETAKT